MNFRRYIIEILLIRRETPNKQRKKQKALLPNEFSNVGEGMSMGGRGMGKSYFLPPPTTHSKLQNISYP